MDPLPEYLRPLEYLTRPFPKEAVAAAIEHREEAVPYLLHSLEWVVDHPDEANQADPPYMLHLFAMFLLAQFREPRAYPLVIRLFRHPQYESLTGDLVTEKLNRILASVAGEDLQPIKALVADRNLDQWVRSAGIEALAALAHGGTWTHAELSQYLGALLSHDLEREPSHVWDSIVAVCTDLGLGEQLPAIRRAYAERLADPRVDLLIDVERELSLAPGTSTRVNWRRYEPINNTIAELGRWHCFKLPGAKERRNEPLSRTSAEYERESPNEPSAYARATPLVRTAPKIGRNDLCPCGSGKKYKKCCGTR